MNISSIHLRTLSRLYYSSSVNYAAIHKTFRKVVGAGISKKRKFKYQDPSILPSVTSLNKISSEAKRTSVSKRASMLNKMFMRYISDLIVNGEHWEEYSKKGIQINRIEISPDYNNVNIFWISKESEEDAIQSFLDENAFTLRHELSQLRVMGVVPPISFVKDKHQSELINLDRRIAIADYGMDYEPISASRVKHQLELYSCIDDKLKIEIEKLEDDEEEMDMELPKMPQNVLALDYLAILNRVLKKSLDTCRQDSINEGLSKKYNGDIDNLSSRDAFRLFLQRRQMNVKKMKQENNLNVEIEYIKRELQENSLSDHNKNIENNLDSFDEDFFEDETEGK